jgi:hypothetical protein
MFQIAHVITFALLWYFATASVLRYNDFEWVPSSAKEEALAAASGMKRSEGLLKMSGLSDKNGSSVASVTPSWFTKQDSRVPQLWKIPEIQRRNNCYNFATAFITNTFAQPGEATDSDFKSITCQQVIESAASDGLVRVEKNAVGVYGKEFHSCRYVALVVTGKNESTTDFHWYRLMKPNYDLVDREEWWHKPGG